MELSNSPVLQLYVTGIVSTAVRMLKTIQGEESPLGSMEKELLFDCGYITELTQAIVPALTDEFNTALRDIQKMDLERAVELGENRLVLSLSALDLLAAKEKYEQDAARPVEEIRQLTKDSLGYSLEHLLSQFDPMTVRRYLKKLEQE